MPFTWQPRFAPSRPRPSEHDKIRWGIRFPLLAGSVAYFLAAFIHAIAGIYYSSVWRIPLIIACLSCGLLLRRLSSPDYFEDPPRFIRLWRYYTVIAFSYFQFLCFRLVLVLGRKAYEMGAWWLTALVIATLAMEGAMIYSAWRGRRKQDERPDVEQLAQDDGSWCWMWWLAMMTEFPPV